MLTLDQNLLDELVRRGVDVVMHDRAFVERHADLVGTIVRPVQREGKVVYER